jgi:hypothetical protein
VFFLRSFTDFSSVFLRSYLDLAQVPRSLSVSSPALLDLLTIFPCYIFGSRLV